MSPVFRHVVLMKFRSPLDADQADRVTRALDDLGAQSPTVRAISHGPDLGVRAGGHDYALVADFDDAQGWQAYSAHPAHDVVRSVMKDLVESQVACQFAVGDPGDGA
ncbi:MULTISPECIES: Dabb family protein [Pseudonocardia]|uniref:Stress responsive A/B Barrel Domain protein n=2 Tax=Pseudonocardia TaxID=1847 RepID=A0A1Y2N0V9_PSEAH|nr:MULTISPECIES: Dabb family protein [Pseudonocardia]OSY40799.1 Stress responsive A/B Barrel Domain protein [Pseudonocardia autotrophica]TDN71894.1 stress responsive alpha/beta barrel protein [Pseudonocardia autotrophica]BBG02582.1 stress protein [Pseudonocardia autotrophica]GEC24641.1 stress protein [Pseudonocardia saturnea]